MCAEDARGDMSTTSRVIIAIVCVASACMFGLMAAMHAVPRNNWGLWLLSAFCLVIAITCIPGKHTAVTGRLIGGVIFAAYVAYVISEIVAPTPHRPYMSFWDALLATGQADILNALIGLVVWGLPAGYVMIFGWDAGLLPGLYAHGENARSSKDEDQEDEEDEE